MKPSIKLLDDNNNDKKMTTNSIISKLLMMELDAEIIFPDPSNELKQCISGAISSTPGSYVTRYSLDGSKYIIWRVK